jgi:hypothetical protein
MHVFQGHVEQSGSSCSAESVHCSGLVTSSSNMHVMVAIDVDMCVVQLFGLSLSASAFG